MRHFTQFLLDGGPDQQTFFSIMTRFLIAYHISLVNVQTNYCNNNLLIFDVKQLNKIMKLYYFYTSKELWDGQGKIKMYYGMSRGKSSYLEKGLFFIKSLNLCSDFVDIMFTYYFQILSSICVPQVTLSFFSNFIVFRE